MLLEQVDSERFLALDISNLADGTEEVLLLLMSMPEMNQLSYVKEPWLGENNKKIFRCPKKEKIRWLVHVVVIMKAQSPGWQTVLISHSLHVLSQLALSVELHGALHALVRLTGTGIGSSILVHFPLSLTIDGLAHSVSDVTSGCRGAVSCSSVCFDRQLSGAAVLTL